MKLRSAVGAREPGRQRGHGPVGVLRQQRHDRLHVAALHRLHVALDDLAQLLVVERAQRGLLTLLGELLVDGLACPLEGAVDGRDRGVERLRDLAGREAEHLAQDQHRALVGGQVLERRDEGQLDALAQLVAGLGRGVAVLEPQPGVRERLDPDGLERRQAEVVVVVDGRGRSRSAAPAWAAARSRSGRCWSRSCRARSAASCGPRTEPGRARRAAAPPGGRPRRRGPSRACGSSGR